MARGPLALVCARPGAELTAGSVRVRRETVLAQVEFAIAAALLARGLLFYEGALDGSAVFSFGGSPAHFTGAVLADEDRGKASSGRVDSLYALGGGWFVVSGFCATNSATGR